MDNDESPNGKQVRLLKPNLQEWSGVEVQVHRRMRTGLSHR
jgi:hypothetical protein